MSEPTLRTSDHRIALTGGTLFARRWRPENAMAGAAAIMLFHDSLGSVELWRDFPARLSIATAREVIAYDRLGFGQSDPHPGSLALDFMREEARSSLPALQEQLALGRIVPFGHSVGGAMAVACGAALGADCPAVITESAQAFVEDRTIAGIREAQAIFAGAGQIERLARYHGDKARWVLDAWIETWLARDFASWSLDGDLQQIKSPILAIHGDRDEYGSAEHPKRIAERAPGRGEAVLFAECGHMPHREAPERVLAVVSTFLKER